MGKESIKQVPEMESAEGRNFGTVPNSIDMSPSILSSQILPQKNPKFTDFLLYQCVFCKASFDIGNAVAVDDGLACEGCVEDVTAAALQILNDAAQRPRKVVRLYQCFGCGENVTARRMSGCLAICRKCFKEWQIEGERARRRLIEKTLNKIGGFLRGRV